MMVFTFQIFGQTYQPLPTSGAMWREYSNGFQCSCCSDYQYTISGDTIINSVVYHKLKKTGVKYFEDNQGYCTQNIQSTINQYSGSFRNDPQNKKVLYISPGDTLETTLYDFNLEIGDTVPPSILNDNGNIVNVVVNIDSIEVGVKFHKQFKLSNGGSFLYFIEGVGSTHGLLSPTGFQFEIQQQLKCLSVNSQPIYPANASSCPIASDLNEIETTEAILIFPNPSSRIITISSPYKHSLITFYNTIGEVVFEERYSQIKIEIDISNLRKGVYLIKISDDSDNFTFKKIMIN